MNEKKETIKDILDGLLSKDSVEALAAIDSAEMIRILLGHVASRIEAAAKRERAIAAVMRAALVEISQMCGVGPNEVSAIQIAYICDKALKTKGE